MKVHRQTTETVLLFEDSVTVTAIYEDYEEVPSKWMFLMTKEDEYHKITVEDEIVQEIIHVINELGG